MGDGGEQAGQDHSSWEEGRRGGGEEGRRGGDRWMEGWRREKEGYSHIIRPTWIASSLLVHVHVA